jgi:hypothetical protein
VEHDRARGDTLHDRRELVAVDGALRARTAPSWWKPPGPAPATRTSATTGTSTALTTRSTSTAEGVSPPRASVAHSSSRAAPASTARAASSSDVTQASIEGAAIAAS